MLFKVINKHTNLKYLNILSTIGANSIVILVTNNLLIEIFRLLEYKVFNNFFLENGIIGAFLMTAILIIPEYYLISISQSKIGILFGKNLITNIINREPFVMSRITYIDILRTLACFLVILTHSAMPTKMLMMEYICFFTHLFPLLQHKYSLQYPEHCYFL